MILNTKEHLSIILFAELVHKLAGTHRAQARGSFPRQNQNTKSRWKELESREQVFVFIINQGFTHLTW